MCEFVDDGGYRDELIVDSRDCLVIYPGFHAWNEPKLVQPDHDTILLNVTNGMGKL